MNDQPVPPAKAFTPFSIGPLQFMLYYIYVMNVHIMSSICPCKVHQSPPCTKYLDAYTCFCLKLVYIDDHAVLLADALWDGDKYCSFGYLDCSVLPIEASEFFAGGLYNISMTTSQMINTSVHAKYNGVIAATYIGRANQGMLFNDYSMVSDVVTDG